MEHAVLAAFRVGLTKASCGRSGVSHLRLVSRVYGFSINRADLYPRSAESDDRLVFGGFAVVDSIGPAPASRWSSVHQYGGSGGGTQQQRGTAAASRCRILSFRFCSAVIGGGFFACGVVSTV